jgi:VIT1/CCC1 family predicted Fe2+/Mn2+ transporter
MWQTQAILSRALESGRGSIFSMPDPDSSPPTAGLPHEIDHRHADVTGGWLRAATFGAMDGLVSNTALIAGVAASASTHTVVLSGVAGLLAFRKHPQAERAELIGMLQAMGMTKGTATAATDEIHRDENRAMNFHLVQELGVDPSEKPSPWIAGASSFVMFAIGAIVPLIPYLLGFSSLWLGLACGGVGLLVAGGVAAYFTRKAVWLGSLRQLTFGGLAIAATYGVGTLVGTAVG